MFVGLLVGDMEMVSDSGSLNSDISELSRRNLELDEHVTELKDQIKSYEDEINKFETLQADWMSEKETLEGVLIELRSQLKDKENVLHTVEAERVGDTGVLGSFKA